MALPDLANYINRYRGPNLNTCRMNIETTNINRKAVQKIFNAWDFAESLHTPITHFVVIHLKDTISQSANTAFAKIRQEFCRKNSSVGRKSEHFCPPTYVYSFENPNNNIHVNWCIHVPKYLEIGFSVKVNNWVLKIQGTIQPHTIKIKKINPQAYKTIANYILKGCDPEYAEHFHLSELQSCKGPQGLTTGKRAGFSPSIGVTAQRNLSFDPKSYRRTRLMGRKV